MLQVPDGFFIISPVALFTLIYFWGARVYIYTRVRVKFLKHLSAGLPLTAAQRRTIRPKVLYSRSLLCTRVLDASPQADY